MLPHLLPAATSFERELATLAARRSQRSAAEAKGSKASTTALVVAPGAPPGARRIWSSAAPLPLWEQAERQARKALVREWTAGDFGQGHRLGGTTVHTRNRYEAVIRLLSQSEVSGHHLPADMQARFPVFAQRCLAFRLANLSVKGAVGVDMVDWIRHWQSRMKEDPSSFKAWVLRGIAKMPPAEASGVRV